MTMLTDEKIKELVSEASLSDYWYSHGDLLVQLVHAAIEAAVLEAQGEQNQKPDVMVSVYPVEETNGLRIEVDAFWLPVGRHNLDAAPIIANANVQPDMVKWRRAFREIIDRCVAPDMYANAMGMLDRLIAAAEKEQK